MRDFITSSTSFHMGASSVLGHFDGNIEGTLEGGQFQSLKDDLYYNLKKRIMKVGKQKKGDKVSINP